MQPSQLKVPGLLCSLQEANARTNHLRKAQHELDDDGLPELHPAKAKAAQEEAAVNRQELENYKKHNPDFKKRMDTVVLALC